MVGPLVDMFHESKGSTRHNALLALSSLLPSLPTVVLNANIKKVLNYFDCVSVYKCMFLCHMIISVSNSLSFPFELSDFHYLYLFFSPLLLCSLFFLSVSHYNFLTPSCLTFSYFPHLPFFCCIWSPPLSVSHIPKV